MTGFWEQAREFQAANGDEKALQKQSPQLVGRGQWVEAALRVQSFSTEMHGMVGVAAAIIKSGMTDAEKLKATDVVAGSMLAVAKLELAAMAQTKQALH